MADELRVVLAGHNVDAELIESVKLCSEKIKAAFTVFSRASIKRKPVPDKTKVEILEAAVETLRYLDIDQFTPETISAAYARISRDPSEIPELRYKAREQVAKARSSNANIIFDMGHKSVGNHAQFNFDILGLSRLAVEYLEARRLGCGYTEKSQRYVKMDGDFVVPKDFSANDRKKFMRLVDRQVKFYAENLDKIIDFHFRKRGFSSGSDVKSPERRTIEGYGKEDARYALGLSTQAQVGTSFNATALEHAVRTMKYAPLAEVRDLAQKLFDCVKDVAPSLILYTDQGIFEKSFSGRKLHDENFSDTPKNLKALVAETFSRLEGRLDGKSGYFSSKGDVKMIACNEVDRDVIAAILHANSGRDVSDCYKAADKLLGKPEEAMAFMKEAWKCVTLFDNPPREFEFSGGLKFEIVLSSSAFAQLKRHRIMTLLSQDYDPSLGITIPESIAETGLTTALNDICGRSAELYQQFLPKYGKAAEYCLTNAHRRRVLVSINPREFNAFERMRSDGHAQWDIRQISHDMSYLAKQAAPLSLLLSCGKDEYDKLRDEIYNMPGPEGRQDESSCRLRLVKK